jgi:hypothetical protein
MTSSIPNRGAIAAPDFSIQPAAIDTRHHFYDAFGHDMSEVSARWIVLFMQEKGSWQPFSQDEIDAYYHRRHRSESFKFNRLVEPQLVDVYHGSIGEKAPEGGGFVVLGKDGLYRVTEWFVKNCYHAAPLSGVFKLNR